jgi:uncharacterized protein YcfJ
MDKSMLKGLVIGAAVAIVGSVAGYSIMNKAPTAEQVAAMATPTPTAIPTSTATPTATPTPEVFADVIKVKEVTKTVKTPRQECQQVAVQKQAPVKDENKIAGTVLGAVVGGVLGNQVGGGSGKKIATVAGVVGGGYAGNKIQGNMQKADTTTVMENQCTTVYDSSKKHLGYDVTYKLNDQQGVVRMTFNPGARIPVKDGKLVLTEPAATTPAAVAPAVTK